VALTGTVVQSVAATYPGTVNGGSPSRRRRRQRRPVLDLAERAGASPTDDQADFDACPAWSSDGKQIAWCHGIRARGGIIEIWTMKANGEEKHQLTQLGGRMTFPDFSPDGTQLVFAGRLPGGTNDDVWRIDADGSHLTQLTTDPGFDGNAAWSPDGSRIVFTSSRIEDTGQVFVMDADGGSQTQLTFDPVFKDQTPDWSPDGSKLSYAAGDPGDILVMDVDGSDQHVVVDGPTDDFGTSWSPDGRFIAFLRFDDRNNRYVDLADGLDPRGQRDGAAVRSGVAATR
jgi:Tol biopolymer transport system component